MITLHVATLDAPPGRLWIAGTRAGVMRVGFGEMPRFSGDAALESESLFAVRRSPGPLTPWLRSLRDHLRGGPTPDVPIVTTPTGFAARVLAVVARIPYGQIRSFDDVARAAGSPRGAHVAGRVLAQNPVPILVPCHRVVRKSGALAGYIGGIPWKRFLLELETQQLRLHTRHRRRRTRT